MMKLYCLRRTQSLPIGIETAWEFFSDPKNLAIITPPWLNLRPVSEVPDEMYAGMLITYRVRPFPGIRTTWLTEITHVDRPRLFVDEQCSGPYKFWHHQHHFRSIDNGTLLEDLVHYALPLAPLGNLAHALVVRRKLERIFDYRAAVMEMTFGKL